MRLKDSLFTRRQFLNSLASLLYPVMRVIFPPEREPEEVILPLAEYANLEENSVKMFAWGRKPGLLKKSAGGEIIAFVGVCTHLDCNVTYLPEQRKFFCACHEGWYDEEGRNISGPPPRPLRRLIVSVEGDNLIIRKEEKA